MKIGEMMTTKEISDSVEEDVDELLKDAIVLFKQAMLNRTEMNIRVARRVTYTVRGITFGVGIFLFVIFFLLNALSEHNQDLIHTVDTMNVNMASITVDMGQMSQILSNMDKNVASMQNIANEVDNMQGNVSVLNESVAGLTGSMSSIDRSMGALTQDITQMTQTFAKMEYVVLGIGKNVEQMANPIKTWGSFFPFP